MGTMERMIEEMKNDTITISRKDFANAAMGQLNDGIVAKLMATGEASLVTLLHLTIVMDLCGRLFGEGESEKEEAATDV